MGRKRAPKALLLSGVGLYRIASALMVVHLCLTIPITFVYHLNDVIGSNLIVVLSALQFTVTVQLRKEGLRGKNTKTLVLWAIVFSLLGLVTAVCGNAIYPEFSLEPRPFDTHWNTRRDIGRILVANITPIFMMASTILFTLLAIRFQGIGMEQEATMTRIIPQEVEMDKKKSISEICQPTDDEFQQVTITLHQ